MKKLLLFLVAGLCFAQPCSTDSRGICTTALTAAQNNILGPLTPINSSPWLYGDKMEVASADNLNALMEFPSLGTQLAGTVSWTVGSQDVATTSDLRASLAGQAWAILKWDTVDGAGTGRTLCNVDLAGSTAIKMHCYYGIQGPTSSGVNAYLLPANGASGTNYTQVWAVAQPTVSWHYYDVPLSMYRLNIRSGTAAYLTLARTMADTIWQWVIDHGYGYMYPRGSSIISQFYRATEGHSERYPGLYNYVNTVRASFADVSNIPNADTREAGYALWGIADGAKTDPDSTRHAQYCTWLGTYANQWISGQSADGSWGENAFAINSDYVSAPASFTPPFIYETSPWRMAIPIRALQATYESLNDTTAAGCNNTSLAATVLTTITKAVSWQKNYGLGSNRGALYELNSQSDDQWAPGTYGPGTVSISLGSTSLVGVGTSWVTDGHCAGTHFAGIVSIGIRGVYKVASCADNTHATLTVAYGLYGEASGAGGVAIGWAPSASTACTGSLATYCYRGTANADRNLTRTMCGDMGWLYSITANPLYKSWTDECLSATLGGPTAGPTNADNIGSFSLPCSGPACDGYVGDTGAFMPNCTSTGNVPPCQFGAGPYYHYGKEHGEAFGAPAIDNALGWRLAFATAYFTRTSIVSGKALVH